VYGAQVPKLSGAILGNVRDSGGISQMGASVSLYNRYEKLVRQVLTNDRGVFVFDGLTPDAYSIRISLSSFVPALKRGIAVEAGSDRVLNVNLTSFLSSIEIVYEAPGGALMSDDWKWALRTALATRPVLRALPQIGGVSTSKRNSNLFADTKGLVNVSAGDATSMASGGGTQTDLGTAFAVATSIYGRNQVQLSGNLGVVPSSGMPASGFRTTYKRTGAGGPSPEITITARQLYLPNRGGQIGGRDVPALRTLSTSMIDRLDITEGVRFEYGFSMDSVTFIERLNYFSPFARLSYSLGKKGLLQAGFSSGAPPVDLYHSSIGNSEAGEPELRRDLAALAILPRVSVVKGHSRIQRAQNFELSYQKEIGRTNISAAVFRESVANAALNLQGPGDLFVGDILPDIGSRGAIFNVGNFKRSGFMTSVTQRLNDFVEASIAVGRGGAITAQQRVLRGESAEELRSVLQSNNRSWASARVTVTAPRAGTKVSSSYGWTDYTAMMPGHLYLTQKALPETGWNMTVRQPLPSISGVPGRIELTGEVRNMLAQGYMPLQAGDRRLLLIQSPRAMRGGLSFIF
jgi:hypothetical protein